MSAGTFDVAIIGGGPAGCAAALTLLRYSKLRVVVIERGDYEGWRVGETLSPGVRPLLRYLDATSIIDDDGHLTNYGTAASWGGDDTVSRDFLFVAAGEGRHLDRARFDRSLAALVRERGGTVMTSCTYETANVDARYVIDASGRHAAFARARGARVIAHDNLTGVVAIVASQHGYDGGTLVGAAPDGWWYSARLPEDRAVVAFMSDADVVREGRLHETSEFLRLLDTSRSTRERLCVAPPHRIVHGPIVCPAQSQLLDKPYGDGWIAAGEAAIAFDPLSSMGIGYALTSGIEAARVAASSLSGGDGAPAYAADVAAHFQSYLARKREYYSIEQRWRERPFWARRHA
ncbi:MAG TPA: FAD-dependent oxidoreductase [Thermoanaerobaculia bacterium]